MRLHGITMSGGDDYKIIGWEPEECFVVSDV
jgi:hypothetical protein